MVQEIQSVHGKCNIMTHKQLRKLGIKYQNKMMPKRVPLHEAIRRVLDDIRKEQDGKL